ncbi:MAG TPA: NUDIX domain-containing protein [Gammaproteobacteria bacterium]|jgi:8-oxo-dGTP diphosphatase|nr:NUDIX domain-containing protein [Gammaproteobacteria bacterium]
MISVVLGFVCNKQGKYLLAKRNAAKEHGGLWEFPGGKIEDGESPGKAIVREIMEEFVADIEVEKLHQHYLYKDSRSEIEFFPISCNLISEVVNPTEHQEYEFLDVKEILKYELAPADYEALEILNKSLSKSD